MDLVERLKAEGDSSLRRHLSLGMWRLCLEAADEIERLRHGLKAIDAAYPEPFNRPGTMARHTLTFNR